jgi:hypothetical protein
MEHKEEIAKKRKDGWLEVWFGIEAIGVDKDVVGKALKAHVEKIARIKDVLVYETSLKESKDIGKPPQGIQGDKAWSQVADVKFFVKDLASLIGIIIVYGPSSVEILGPAKKEFRIDELQNTANTVAGIMHEFASRGVGGVLISAEQKK